jgi:hemerythrin superfamily protein
MSDAGTSRDETMAYGEDDVVGILLRQHVRIRELFTEVRSEQGQRKQQAFDELRALLAVHETAEEMIVRPVAKEAAGAKEADARNREEKEANKILAKLEKMDVTGADFDARFAQFERAVLAHAEHEETEEFPAVRSARSERDLAAMGKRLRAAEKFAPTHPHPTAAGSPTAQWTVGPFAAIADRVRDAMRS